MIMESIATKIANFRDKIPGRAYLLLAVIIFAPASSIVRQLTQIGEQNLIAGKKSDFFL